MSLASGRLLLVVATVSWLGCRAGDDAASATAAPNPDRAAAAAPADPAKPFECGQQSERGFQRLVETARTASTSSIRIETDYFGGATDAVVFGMTCLGRLSQERGFGHYVILDSHAVRYGTFDTPGNDWEATIGFLVSADQDPAATFAERAEDGKPYRIWPATTAPAFTPALISSDVWDLFSSPHFHYRQPGQEPSDDFPPAFLARKADEAEKRLAATRGDDSWQLGQAAKSAARAGRFESAEAWGRELLSKAVPETDTYGNAVHDAHTALGLVAMHREDLDAARIHLLKSGMTPGSPTLGSFGPNMWLARELLQADDREVVLQYFDLCRAFWKHDDGALDRWEAIVREGGMPTFGANLLY